MKKLEETILKDILDPKETYVVGVSTGIDSMSLLYYLYTNHYNVVVAHINHKKRVESDSEYKFLENYCKERNIPFEGYELEGHYDSNFQARARAERYKFFLEILHKYHTKNLVLAHQLDDLAETIIMRLIRGTSIKGYKGIAKIEENPQSRVLRPLLYTSRESIERYQERNHIPYFNDSSNDTDEYTRNYVRHHILPLFKEINPNVLEQLLNFSIDIDSAASMVDTVSRSFISYEAFPEEKGIYVRRDKFNNLPTVAKERVLILMFDSLTANSAEIQRERINQIINLAETAHESKTIELNEKFVSIIEYDKVRLTLRPDYSEVNVRINGFGEYDLGNNKVAIFSQNYNNLPQKNSYCLCYNEEKSIFPIIIRNRKLGDKITVNSITKNVSRVLIDEKVPRSERDNVLVVLNDSGIFFIPNILRKETDSSLPNKLYITIEEKSKEV